ncbi:MAG: glycosyltransferase family 4 protein [Pseudanabaenales cyanobacterium]|nr:glycosyltransferase family 4 protein [Pseudanabaenales cyanobacterium]
MLRLKEEISVTVSFSIWIKWEIKDELMGVKDNQKISIIVSDLSQSGAGRWGGAVRPFLLAQALSQLGYEVEILGFSHDQTPISTSFDFPVTVLAGGHYPKFFKSAQQLLAKIDGDIVYAYKLKPSSYGLALIDKLRTKRPLLLDIDDWELSWHGGDRWRYRPSFQQLARDLLRRDGALRNPDYPLYLSWIEKWVAWADCTTLHSQFLKKRFGGVYIPNGKDITLFDPSRYDPESSRRRYGLSDYRVLMFPGAPRPYKGLEDVLAALDQLNEPDLKLVIVGGSPYDDYDDRLMQKWGRWIIQLPKFSYSVMPDVIAAAHIVVVPQQNAPAAQAQFPLKLTDGMAMAKPILATRVGDIPEILGNTGFLVEPGSPSQIATEIQWIFQHLDDANTRGLEARKRCVKHYSIDAMAALLSSVFAEL